jgi:hypothetical protein
MARRKLNNRTQGLKNFVQMALNHLENGNVSEAKLTLTDLINDIGGAYVCTNPKPKTTNNLPKYNAKRDGDYSRWLVANNID